MSDLSNKAYAWLMASLIAIVVTVAMLWRLWRDLDTYARYAGIAIACIIALAALFLAIRAVQEIAKHAEVIKATKTTRLLQKDEHEKKWSLEQQRAAQEHERLMFELNHKALLESQRFQLEQHLAMTRILPSEHGYAALIERALEGYSVTQIPYMGRAQIAPGPGTSQGKNGQAPAGNTTRIYEQPTQDSLLSKLQRGGLEVAPGIDTVSGEMVILSIPDAVHFKLIGSSGFGKSCLAAALIDQATKLNGPDRLQIALLDCEHKTARLFEDLPHVVEAQSGTRRIPLVATDADEVAVHLRLLAGLLRQRAQLSEYDLQRLPVMLIYVEEMLSLQYEVDPKLLTQMLADLSVLALRARKYNMFLVAVAQTDYSTDELKAAQKQFRSRMAFAVDTTAARAAGFMSTDLIKENFATAKKGDGHFVCEYPGYAGICVAPSFDVRAMLLARSTPVSTSFQERVTPPTLHVVGSTRNDDEEAVKSDETPRQARARAIQKLREKGWGKVAIIEKVYGVKSGGTIGYRNASAEYEQITNELVAVDEGEAR